MSAAVTALATGRIGVAARELRTYLSSNQQDADARYHYARALAGLGELPRAVDEYRRLLAIQPRHLAALVDLGVAWSFLGNHKEAVAVLERAKAVNPEPAELHFALGVCNLGLGHFAIAESAFRTAIARNFRIPDVYENLGVAVCRQQRYAEAIDCFRQAVALNPNLASAKANLGDALLRVGSAHAAVEAYRDAAALLPDDPLIHAGLGAALLIANEVPAAIVSLERALSLDEDLADVAINLGTALRRSQRHERAHAMYAHALAKNPDHPEALLELGLIAAERGDAAETVRLLLAAQGVKPHDAAVALKVAQTLDRVGRRAEALEVYEHAAATIPANADIHDAHGRLLHRLGRHSEALSCYARALALDATRTGTQLNRGNALESLGSIAEAVLCFQRVLASRPDECEAIAGAASCAFRICDWTLAEAMVARLLERPEGIDALHPFLRFALDLEPAVLAESCRRTARAVATRTPASFVAPYSHERLRIAYISPDFRQHPVAYALAGVIERHDRRRIEVIGVSLAAPDQSDIGARIKSSFDEFIDCAAMTDAEVVRILRLREIDIAVDLAGFTAGARSGIFASRAAPVQLAYLGFPGSTGADFMDALVADAVVIPPGEEHLYAEKIVRLPHSYLPFDRNRACGAAWSGRAGAGLPPEGFVFCGFSNGYKITRAIFSLWMRLLVAVPESVLWLRGGNAIMERNLIAAAQDFGVPARRLVFASFVPQMAEHLARLEFADLFLDTLPYNAHTTAVEALWAGVPVITCRGRTFAGRVGASVLTAAGLPELVCESPEAYFERALCLARSPHQLAELRRRTAASKVAAPAFDSLQYVRDLEEILIGLHAGISPG